MAGYGGGKILTHARLPSVTLYQSALLVHHQLEMVGLSRFELLTPRLSSVCSNQLSYRPSSPLSRHSPRSPSGGSANLFQRTSLGPIPSKLDRTYGHDTRQVSDRSDCPPSPAFASCDASARYGEVSRKEVIQPQVLLQLPCYDFTPITDHTLGTCVPCGFAQRLLVQPAFVM